MRRAALSYGFYEVFIALSELISKEILSNTLTPESTLHLTYIINCLSTNEYKDIRNDIPVWIQPNTIYNRKIK